MQSALRSSSSSLRAPSRVQDARRSVPALAPRSSRRSVTVLAAHAPPTVADTKKRFMDSYKRPIPAIYNTVIQELLVQQHFIRYNVAYQYNEVFALGFVSVFEQILDSFDADQRAQVFDAYISALGEEPRRYRADAERLESEAKALSGPDGLAPDANGSDLQRVLARVAEASSEGKLAYNKFFAIGLFRLLELTGAKEPAALERLVKSVGAKPDAVNKDLLLYKGILSKLAAAKELMREFLEREKKKQAERDAAKAEKGAPASAQA